MSVLQQINQELANVVAVIRPNLVQIANGEQSGAGSKGAGVIWDADGLIVTNAHVVAPSIKRRRQPKVTLPSGETVSGRIVALDRKADLAAIEIETDGLDAVRIGDSDALTSGDWVTAIGHPWGVIGAVTSGTVISVSPSPEINYPGDLVQVGLHMRPGHSGGPMVNAQGELIGINCMIAGPDVGLAIPSATVKKFMQQVRLA